MALVVALSSGIATKKKWEVLFLNNVWEKANFTKCLLCMRHGSELDPYTTVVSCWAEPWNVKGSPVPQRRQKVSELGSSGLSRLSRLSWHSQKKLKKHRKSAQNLQFKDVQRFADLRCNRSKEICALFWQEIKIDGCQALQKTSRGPAEREALQGLSECLELRTTQTRLERFEAICERFERFAIGWQSCWHRFCWQFPFDFCILIV